MLLSSYRIPFLIPYFVEMQRKSFLNFLNTGLNYEVSKKNPMYVCFKQFKITFYPEAYKLSIPEYTSKTAILKFQTYASKLYIPVEFTNSTTKELKLQWILLGTLPLMTKRGHFIVNGCPRVIVNQIVRSPGIYYKIIYDEKKRKSYYGDLISQRGAWLRLEIDKKKRVWVKIKKSRKIPILIFFKALGISDIKLEQSTKYTNFLEISKQETENIESTDYFHPSSVEDSLIWIYGFVYPEKKEKGQVTLKKAKKFLFQKFFNHGTYDLGNSGRNQLNKKFNLKISKNTLVLTPQDLLYAIDYLIKLEHGIGVTDDIDDLKNRRVRTSGELLQNQVGTGFIRLEKFIKNKTENPTFNVSKIFSSKPVDGALREFFGSSPLSQFMDQTNPLAELTHKRRISSLGPGGVSRETAGMQVRGIHASHYGRICPIETPEGRNAGLVNSLTTLARINKQGFIETPFYNVYQGQIQKFGSTALLSATHESQISIAASDLQANYFYFLPYKNIPARAYGEFQTLARHKIQYMSVSPIQMISIATSLIPFLEHDDANRALMGSNMQRQAVPLILPERPVVGTGLETRVISDSGHGLQANTSGVVIYTSSKNIRVKSFVPVEKNLAFSVAPHLVSKKVKSVKIFPCEQRGRAHQKNWSGSKQQECPGRLTFRNFGTSTEVLPNPRCFATQRKNRVKNIWIGFTKSNLLKSSFIKNILHVSNFNTQPTNLKGLNFIQGLKSSSVDANSVNFLPQSERTLKFFTKNRILWDKRNSHKTFALKKPLLSSALSILFNKTSFIEGLNGTPKFYTWHKTKVRTQTNTNMGFSGRKFVVSFPMSPFLVYGTTTDRRIPFEQRKIISIFLTQFNPVPQSFVKENRNKVHKVKKKIFFYPTNKVLISVILQEQFARENEIFPSKRQESRSGFPDALGRFSALKKQNSRPVSSPVTGKNQRFFTSQAFVSIVKRRSLDESFTKQNVFTGYKSEKWYRVLLSLRKKSFSNKNNEIRSVLLDRVLTNFNYFFLGFNCINFTDTFKNLSQSKTLNYNSQHCWFPETGNFIRKKNLKGFSYPIQFREVSMCKTHFLGLPLELKIKINNLQLIAILSGLSLKTNKLYFTNCIPNTKSIWDMLQMLRIFNETIPEKPAELGENFQKTCWPGKKQNFFLRRNKKNYFAFTSYAPYQTTTNLIFFGDKKSNYVFPKKKTFWLKTKKKSFIFSNTNTWGQVHGVKKSDINFLENTRDFTNGFLKECMELVFTQVFVKKKNLKHIFFLTSRNWENFHNKKYLPVRFFKKTCCSNFFKGSGFTPSLKKKNPILKKKTVYKKYYTKNILKNYSLAAKRDTPKTLTLHEVLRRNFILKNKAKRFQFFSCGRWVESFGKPNLQETPLCLSNKNLENFSKFYALQKTRFLRILPSSYKNNNDFSTQLLETNYSAQKFRGTKTFQNDQIAKPIITTLIKKTKIPTLKLLFNYTTFEIIQTHYYLKNLYVKSSHFYTKKNSLHGDQDFCRFTCSEGFRVGKTEFFNRATNSKTQEKSFLATFPFFTPLDHQPKKNYGFFSSLEELKSLSTRIQLKFRGPLNSEEKKVYTRPAGLTKVNSHTAKVKKKFIQNRRFEKVNKIKNSQSPVNFFSETQSYILGPYQHSNQNTCLHQVPLVYDGEWIQKGDLLTDGAASVGGELALGKSISVAYMPWEGYNFEDAILVSERLIYDDLYTSIHIEKYTTEISDTQYGREQITASINVPVKQLFNLDKDGIIKFGTWVTQGDILVGKLTPIRERKLSGHEKLLSDVLGMKKNISVVKDTSLRVPKYISGRVVHIERLENDIISSNNSSIPPSRVHIYIAEKKKVQVGDKMSGRHGNKGIISKILPRQDMPYLADGTPIDMVLNPLGVPSRMNVGQIFECLLGLAAKELNQQFKISCFDEMNGAEASRSFTYSKLFEARVKTGKRWLFHPDSPGKMKLFDGRTGECFHQSVTVGKPYMLKLIHLVDDKIHARSTGPYSLVTQQPVRGRSKQGGQRLGEMEVWALEGFGAAYTLQELLTMKSDDIEARHQVIQAILERKSISVGTPESFKVLLLELQSLCLHIGVYSISNTGNRQRINSDYLF